MNSCNFTYKANSLKSLAETHTSQKLRHFGRYDAKVKLFSQKRFVPVTRAGVFIWENFYPVYRDLRRENRDLGNQTNPACHMNTWKFLRRKQWRETDPARLTALV